MLIHICPTIFAPNREVCLYRLTVRELGLRLKGDDDLRTCQPYRNKHFKAACRKDGRKSRAGILIETPETIDKFWVAAEWAVDASFIARHDVLYTMLDHEFDAASGSPRIWRGMGEWQNRWPEDYRGRKPIDLEPKMELEPRYLPIADNHGKIKMEPFDHDGMVEDFDAACKNIVNRFQCFEIPSIEPERLSSPRWAVKLPPLSSSFKCGDPK